jgi:hypothetical protein
MLQRRPTPQKQDQSITGPSGALSPTAQCVAADSEAGWTSDFPLYFGNNDPVCMDGPSSFTNFEQCVRRTISAGSESPMISVLPLSVN